MTKHRSESGSVANSSRRLGNVSSSFLTARNVTQAGAGLLVLVVVWGVLTYSGFISPFFLASPTEVIKALVELTFAQEFLYDVLMSIFRIVAGFLLSLVVAIPVGAIIVMSPVADRVLSPPLSFIRYLPVPALLPFLILWLGVGEIQKVSVVFVGVFFQLILMVVDVLRTTPRELEDIAQSLGASGREILWTVTFPHASPALYDAARVTLAWAWGWVMLAELVGADSGIGHMILISQRYLLNARMIAGLLTVGLLGLASDALLAYARPRLFRWAS